MYASSMKRSASEFMEDAGRFACNTFSTWEKLGEVQEVVAKKMLADFRVGA